MFFSDNIRFLRIRRNRSQEEVAIGLGIKRSSINNYENNYAEPGLRLLVDFSRYFSISTDNLLNIELSKLSESKLRDLEIGHDTFIRGSRLRVLATTVDSKNRDNIELVPHRAKAGYTNGYNDPEFISGLPTFQLPFLHRERKYRTFQISGDSMLPIPDKAFITAEYVENWNDIIDGHAYIVLTLDEGIVFKVLYNNIRKTGKLLLKSMNPAYEPYEVNIVEVKEVWKFVNYISQELPQSMEEQLDMGETVTLISEQVKKLNDALNRKNPSLFHRKPRVR